MKTFVTLLLLATGIYTCPAQFLFNGNNSGSNRQLPCNNWLSVLDPNASFESGDIDVSGNKMTIECVFNRTQPYSGNYLYAGDLVSKHRLPTNCNYLLRPNSAEITTTDGHYYVTPPVCDIQLDKTYHVAMVYDGSTLKFYRNGFLMSQVAASGNLFQNNFNTSVGDVNLAPMVSGENLIGNINEVRIWNIARSQSEIRTYMNSSLPTPTTQTGLLAYFTFDNLLNKQGNAAWNGMLTGTASINATNTACNFIADSCSIVTSPVTASFDAPASVCINTPLQVTNTSQNASNYYWSFCETNFQAPVATNLGNPGSVLALPVFTELVKDQNGDYYGFVVNHIPSGITRYRYGNSYLNTPAVDFLGNIGNNLPREAEGIKIVRANNKWMAVVVGGDPTNGSISTVATIDFGNLLTNPSPVCTNWGNVGNLMYPIDLSVFQENGNWYGFTVNSGGSNSITRFNFGNFTAAPTGTNLGNIGGMNEPVGIGEINKNGSWYLFVTNEGNSTSTLTRLSFGSSLLNTPSGVNIGNPGGTLSAPRDISFLNLCDGITALVPNGAGSTLTQLNFGDDLTSVPAANNLGNIGNLSFPHSISSLFRVDNDIYAFVPNVNNNTLTRLRFAGCQGVPGSSLQTPGPITYPQPGTYNINLIVDIGLPTQTSFCKKVIVQECAVPVTASFDAPATVCVNTPVQVTNTSQNATNYYWSFCESNFQTPAATNLGNVGSVLSQPVFTELVKDQNGDYYGFVVNHIPSGITRYNYGNSYLNTPTVDFLGNIGNNLPREAEGLKIVRANNKWIGVIVGGNTTVGSQSQLAIIDFGNSLANPTPVCTNWGNVGNLNYPIDLCVFQAGGNWYGYTVNSISYTLTRFSFGADFSTTPTGVNLGNIGGMNEPVGIGEINNNGNWYVFVTNEGNNTSSLTRLFFGNSLLNDPVGVNIGNPGNLLSAPRDVSFLNLCDGITALVPNGAGNTITELNFGNDLSVNPTATDLGNIGNLSFPHSISSLFRVDNDIYAFVPNVTSNTLTRLRFAGCQGIPGSSQQTPGPVTYTQPGTYNINLIVDIGLPTQTSFCKKVIVTQCNSDTIVNAYTPVLSLDVCKNIINVQDASAYNVGDTVLVIQMKGAVIDTTNTASFGNILNYKNAGNYEFNYVKAKTGNAIELQNGLTRGYDIPTGKVQLVRVPYYFNFSTTKTLTCLPWDGSKGGILVFNVRDTLKLQADVDVTGKGFSGGHTINSNLNSTNCFTNGYFYPFGSILAATKGESISTIGPDKQAGKGRLASGGGGGLDHNSGGGGGGNATIGGIGGYPLFECDNSLFDSRGIAGNGLSYTNALNRIYLGGGGGAGHCNNGSGFPPEDVAYNGGNGGGIVLINANRIAGNNFNVIASGDSAYEKAGTGGETHDGMGGGGAGGTVLIKTTEYINNLTINVNGGRGADMHAAIAGGHVGPGGGGAGGVLWLNQATLPAVVGVQNTGGRNGVIIQDNNNAYGSAPGSAGTSIFNLVLPAEGTMFKQNIDSVRFNSAVITCASFNFNGLGYTNTSPIATWQWTFGDGSTAATQNVSHTYTTSGTIPVKLVVTDINGCKDSITNNITIAVLTIDAGLDTAYCATSAVRTLHATGIGSGTYSWTPANLLDNSTSQNPVATITGTTKFYVTIMNAQGCSAIDSITLTLKTLPVVQSIADPAVCAGTALQLTTTGAQTYSWSPATYVNNPSIASPIYTSSGSQTLYVTGTAANGCIGKDTVNVTIKPLPVVRTIADSLICSNQGIVLTTTGAQTYSWSPAAGLDNSNSPSPVFSGSHGNGTYYVTGTGANNCMAKDTINITVRSRTALLAPPNAEMCIATSVVLNGNNGNNVTYAWSPAGSLSNPSIINPVATPANTQAYTLTMTDKVCRYDSNFTVTVTVNPLPVIDASKSNDITCAQPTAKLTATGGVTYSWTPAGTLTGATTATPTARPAATTIYTVTGRNAKGCVNSDTITVFIKTGLGGFGIPNTFTPNGDGKNECFGIRHWGDVSELTFIIFNRWGEKVFETNNVNVCWDGKYKGANADQGNYIYYIKGKIACGEIIRKGNVLLIR